MWTHIINRFLLTCCLMTLLFHSIKGQSTKLNEVGVAGVMDFKAENMLLYQRAIGGWPKAVNEIKVDYTKQLSAAEKKALLSDSLHNDATIDNNATTREIRYLVKAFKQTKNQQYLKSAEKGIRYYLMAQNKAGGWPQYFPDSSSYRGQITYNDNAMMNVLNVLQDLIDRKNDFDVMDTTYLPATKEAISRGVDCILLTQIPANGKLTGWCAQYNNKTLKPEMARKYELPSLSGNESVAIVRFLMRIKNPSEKIKQSIKAAVEWLEQVKVVGYKYVDIDSSTEPNGKDRVIKKDVHSIIWARFYEIETNRPFFSGRDTQIKCQVSEIEVERRTGYSWYGTWPEKLLKTDYPEWKRRLHLN